MRIFLIGPLKASPFSRAIERTLTSLGHQVGAFDSRGSYQQQTFYHKVLARLQGRDGITQMNVELAEAAIAFKPDFIFVLKGETVSPETLDHLKKRTGATLASWHVDNPLNVLCSTRRLVEGLHLYDFVFIFDPYYIPELRSVGVIRPLYLPLCYDESLDDGQPLTREEQEKFGASIAFVGHASNSGVASNVSQRHILLESIADLGLKLWGQRWDRSTSARLRSCVAGTAFLANGTDLAKAYRAAKLAFNINTQQSIDGLNMRSFEAPGFGSCLLTNRTRMLEAHFNIGDEVVAYENAQDLREKAQYYLAHDEERRTIAANGQRRCRRDHTMTRRMQEMLEVVQKG